MLPLGDLGCRAAFERFDFVVLPSGDLICCVTFERALICCVAFD
jgi:hypothetical protein